MGDSFTETTTTSWGSRISESIKGVLVGLIMFVASFVVLFWNEGRAVTRANSLKEGAAAVVDVASDKVDAANDKKLVHLTGPAATTETLSDEQFGVSANAIKLLRRAQMYQWVEKSETKTTKKVGGGEEKTTTYTYNKDWSDRAIDSSGFHVPTGHANPSMPFSSMSKTAKVVTLGAFTLPESVVSELNKSEARTLTPEDLAKLSADLKGRTSLTEGGFYIQAAGGAPMPVPSAVPSASPSPSSAGPESASSPAASPSAAAPAVATPAEPKVGDIKVSFSTVPNGTYSLVARQIGSTFEAYPTQAGSPILLVQAGTQSAEAMFKKAQEENAMLTWILRLVGFALMFIGLALVLKPFSVVADVLPFLGDLVSLGTGLVAFLVALVLSLITIAIAWVAARPVMGIIMLAVAVGVAVLAIMRGRAKARAKKAARAAQPASPASPTATPPAA